jgi:hypothetical protein
MFANLYKSFEINSTFQNVWNLFEIFQTFPLTLGVLEKTAKIKRREAIGRKEEAQPPIPSSLIFNRPFNFGPWPIHLRFLPLHLSQLYGSNRNEATYTS